MSDTRKTTKPNVPNLRFPGFEGEWDKLKVRDFTRVVARATPATDKKEYWGGVIRWMNSGELNLKRVYEVQGRITQLGYDKTSTKIIPPHSVLIGLAGQGKTRGTAAMNYVELCTNQSIASILPSDSFYSEFLYQNVESRYKELRDISSGDGGRGGLNLQMIYNLYIPHCSMQEQKKIGDFLYLLDQRIAIQNKVIEDLKKLKTALEERMLGQCQGKQVRLRDILIERVEKSRINNQYEVLSSTVSGIYSQREYFNKEIASADNTGYKAIHRGDVVLSPQNLWMGNINYNDRFEIGIVSPSYKVFSIDEKFDKGYIAFLLKTRKALWAYSLVSEQGASIVRRNLNYESFLEISFVIPSLKEQQATARRLSAFKQKQTMEEAFLRSLLLQKEFMLKSLFI